jgi:hypothetical protein
MRLLELQGTLSDLRRQRRDGNDDLDRPWTEEDTLDIIESVLNWMALLNLSKLDACDHVATTWHRRREDVLDLVTAWVERRELPWSRPRAVVEGGAESGRETLGSVQQPAIVGTVESVVLHEASSESSVTGESGGL